MKKEEEVENEFVYVEQTLPDRRDTTVLILSVIKQAVEDWGRFHPSITRRTKLQEQIWYSADSFLFNPQHKIDWGDDCYSTQDLLDHVDWPLDRVQKAARESLIYFTNKQPASAPVKKSTSKRGRSRPVEGIDIDGHVIRFDSVVKARERGYYNLSANIREGTRVKGYLFRYL